MAVITGGVHAAEIANPRVEYRVNPLGIDVVAPRFSWELGLPAGEGGRGMRQIACQILVASSPEKLNRDNGDLWDTGKVSSDQSIHVPYAGRPLVSGQDCFWKVRVWARAGGGGEAMEASAWSKPARWSMGLLKPEDWQAQWIGADYQRSPEMLADDHLFNLNGLKWQASPRGQSRGRFLLQEGL